MVLESGYETKTTFFQDFAIAERFGASAIQDTFDRAFKEWKGNYIYLTELVLVLNLNLWKHYNKGNMEIAKLYDKLWKQADCYAMNNLKDEELEYFYWTLD